MAFPTTPILDDFNTGALQNLTARPGWSATIPRTGHTTAATDATPTKAICGATNKGNSWATQAADCEAYVTFTDLTFGSGEFELICRLTATGSLTCYFLRILSGSTTEFHLAKWVAGSGTLISSGVSIATAPGDSIGMSAIGTTITSYYKAGAGAWAQQEQVTDSSVTGSGDVAGFVTFGTGTANIDSIGGGAVSGTTAHSLLLTGVGA